MTETIARLHIALADTDPLIWRRVEVPVDASLKMLHDVIQGAMGWLDYHLWEFEADDRRYGVPDPEWKDDRLFAAKNTRLKTLLDRGVRRFLYTYDMGDSWEHIVTVEAIEDGQPATKYPRYVDGRRRAPPEDCGGTPGFEAFLDAIANPKHPEHKDATEWHHGCYGHAFDPETIDELDAKLTIGAIAKRRAAGKASQAKKSD
ncbi:MULTISPECIES: plasmid pRiA4b ORF-3 family protein [unclassified Sphingomonas]|uniref:plasmid pRiA4b ORF-3 family protein n=1 Tax=unclassified Sphingomonas TaxID=196159 RepID=UPI00082C278F|nr:MULTISPECIES: plasmid pRiA4b ORF-3 family protein [unclassified Sphingomonas]